MQCFVNLGSKKLCHQIVEATNCQRELFLHGISLCCILVFKWQLTRNFCDLDCFIIYNVLICDKRDTSRKLKLFDTIFIKHFNKIESGLFLASRLIDQPMISTINRWVQRLENNVDARKASPTACTARPIHYSLTNVEKNLSLFKFHKILGLHLTYVIKETRT